MLLDTKRDMFSRAEVERVYSALSADLGIDTPSLRWSERAVNGTYYAGDRTIALGPRIWRQWHCALHEYAHHVNHFLGVEVSGSTIRFHGPQFREALEMVAHMALGDASLYAWATEYKTIVKWHGKARG